MTTSSTKLDWCVARLGSDLNWWVDEISDPIHWDLDGLSIIDPKQMSHIMDLIDPLRAYGFEETYLEAAFFPFRIDKDLGKQRVRLARTSESLLDPAEPLFALPNLMDEEKGAYADFLDHIIKLRVKLLNDLLDFDQNLSVDELEDEIREAQQKDFLEGRSVHIFNELMSVLDYVPAGYQLEDEDIADHRSDDEVIALGDDDLPEVDEDIEEDDTMRWGDEEDDEEEDDKDEEEWEDEEEDWSDEGEEEEKPKHRR